MPATSTTKEDEPVSSGILTNVSADYRRKLRDAEIKTFIQKSKLDIDNPTVPVKGRSRTRVLVSSSSSSEEEEEVDKEVDVSGDRASTRLIDRPPSPPPRYHPFSAAVVGDDDVLSGLAEIRKVRRELAEDRLRCGRGSGGWGGEKPPTVVESPSTTSSPTANVVVDGSLRIKVLCLNSGVLRRVRMAPGDTFAAVYDQMASAEGVVAEDVRLTLRDSTTIVRPGDTFGDHNLTICDIVECVVVRKGAAASTSTTPGEEEAGQAPPTIPDGEKNPHEISLNIQSPSSKTGQFTAVRISRRAAMKALMEEFAANQSLSVEKLKFFFDGERIDANSTPEELDMEDDDCIDVVVQP